MKISMRVILFCLSTIALQACDNNERIVKREASKIKAMIHKHDADGVLRAINDLCNEEMMTEELVFEVRDQIIATGKSNKFEPVHIYLKALFVDQKAYWSHPRVIK